MSTTQSPNTFAYGANNLDGCECPALAAGMNPCGTGDEHIPGLIEAAEWYDNIIQSERREYEGTVGEEMAKDAWLKMMREKPQEGTVTMSAAEEVAKYHDWI